MKKIYEKSEVTFSLIWIGIYVVLFSVADSISLDLGTAKIVTVPLCLVMTAYLAVWIRKNGLSGKYGLGRVKIVFKDYLYFLPLVIIASTNFWGGFTLNLTVMESELYVVSMLCVGFIEEIIFRGFLFKALCKNNVKQAVIISSLTFGIGHIVNLLNGAELISTLLQICYAVAIGFMFTIIFYRSKSLYPCVITHSAINSFSTFAVERIEMADIMIAIILTVVSVAYAVWLIHSDSEKKAYQPDKESNT